MALPKIIHYCWFGDKDLPVLEQECFKTWNEKLSDYQIMLWNEKNTTFDIEFVKYAAQNKQWAFVSDYIRLKSLYDYGGIYLDTDMYVVRGFDSFLKEECFFGAESESRISCGIIGAEKNHPFIKKCLEYYENLSFFDNSHFTLPITKITTKIFREFYGYESDFSSNIKMSGIKIFSSEYFYPIPYNEFRKPAIDNLNCYGNTNTFAIHLWSGSWQGVNEFKLIGQGQYIQGAFKILIKLFSKEIYTKKYLKKINKAFKISKGQLE